VHNFREGRLLSLRAVKKVMARRIYFGDVGKGRANKVRGHLKKS